MVSLVSDEGRYFDESFSAILVKAFELIPVDLVVKNIFLLTYLAHCFAILYNKHTSVQITLDSKNTYSAGRMRHHLLDVGLNVFICSLFVQKYHLDGLLLLKILEQGHSFVICHHLLQKYRFEAFLYNKLYLLLLKVKAVFDLKKDNDKSKILPGRSGSPDP